MYGCSDRYKNEDDQEMPVGALGHFLSLCQLAGHPITVINTEDKFVDAKVEAQLEQSH